MRALLFDCLPPESDAAGTRLNLLHERRPHRAAALEIGLENRVRAELDGRLRDLSRTLRYPGVELETAPRW